MGEETENELDGKLVLRIAQGDEEAMRELWQSCRREAVTVARALQLEVG